MKTKKNLRTLGFAAVAAATLSNVGSASPVSDGDTRPIDRLQQIRAEYLKAIGMPEHSKPDRVQIAQWLNFPNFNNFPNWGNGWRNY
ncbi:hypothetical protein HFO49_03355 [Rhizobium leguminosarum]|uniref:hypothetical protein n=1 Tax=Rhizobium leguminosarum TaxID=384 RepID=UPI001C96A3F4|nr:hypothetical protein [Rhizobium leguminosarum]MBY5586525.1 hypothetical protein [Rhizobium leguminosarum]